MTPLTSPESHIKKPRIDELDEPPIQELPPSVASLALCSPSHPSLALTGQVELPTPPTSEQRDEDAPVGLVSRRTDGRGSSVCMFAHSCPSSSSFANFCTFQHWLGRVCL